MFREMLPLLASKGLHLRVKGRLYNACVGTTIIYSEETWTLNAVRQV